MADLAQLVFSNEGAGHEVLILGAHCDDIEIGCGATLVDLARRWPRLAFRSIIFCSDETREQETRAAMRMLLGDDVELQMTFGGMKDGYLPYRAEQTKAFLAEHGRERSPDLIFTHYRHDLHQDHSFVSSITRQVFRDGLILEMEIPKYDGDMGSPNVYFPVSESAVAHKIATLMSSYPTQVGKHWFSEATFAATLRLRGLECKASSGMAEAFYGTKLILS